MRILGFDLGTRTLGISISDETGADNEYEKMIDMVKNEESLSDTDKALISTMLIKIETDEDVKF